MPVDESRRGERELPGRAPGALFPWVKGLSLLELAIFLGLLVVWLAPGMEHPTFWFGLAHGIGFILLCLLIWVAVMRREAPFWLLAAALTPAGPVGSTIGIEVIERRGRSSPEAPPGRQASSEGSPDQEDRRTQADPRSEGPDDARERSGSTDEHELRSVRGPRNG